MADERNVTGDDELMEQLEDAMESAGFMDEAGAADAEAGDGGTGAFETVEVEIPAGIAESEASCTVEDGLLAEDATPGDEGTETGVTGADANAETVTNEADEGDAGVAGEAETACDGVAGETGTAEDGVDGPEATGAGDVPADGPEDVAVETPTEPAVEASVPDGIADGAAEGAVDEPVDDVTEKAAEEPTDDGPAEIPEGIADGTVPDEPVGENDEEPADADGKPAESPQEPADGVEENDADEDTDDQETAAEEPQKDGTGAPDPASDAVIHAAADERCHAECLPNEDADENEPEEGPEEPAEEPGQAAETPGEKPGDAGKMPGLSDIADMIGGYASKAIDTAAPYVEKARSAAAPYIDKAVDAASGRLNDAMDVAGGYVDKARNAAAPYIDKAVDAASGYMNDARDAVGGYVGKLRNDDKEDGVQEVSAASIEDAVDGDDSVVSPDAVVEPGAANDGKPEWSLDALAEKGRKVLDDIDLPGTLGGVATRARSSYRRHVADPSEVASRGWSDSDVWNLGDRMVERWCRIADGIAADVATDAETRERMARISKTFHAYMAIQGGDEVSYLDVADRDSELAKSVRESYRLIESDMHDAWNDLGAYIASVVEDGGVDAITDGKGDDDAERTVEDDEKPERKPKRPAPVDALRSVKWIDSAISWAERFADETRRPGSVTYTVAEELAHDAEMLRTFTQHDIGYPDDYYDKGYQLIERGEGWPEEQANTLELAMMDAFSHDALWEKSEDGGIRSAAKTNREIGCSVVAYLSDCARARDVLSAYVEWTCGDEPDSTRDALVYTGYYDKVSAAMHDKFAKVWDWIGHNLGDLWW